MFLQDSSQCEDLICCRFTWSETTLVAPDDVAQVRFQSFTEDGREYLVADVQDADNYVIGILSPVSFLMDRIVLLSTALYYIFLA